MATGHFMEVCKVCGTVVNQCRCPSLDKDKRMVICRACAGKSEKVMALGDTAKAIIIKFVPHKPGDGERSGALADLEALQAEYTRLKSELAWLKANTPIVIVAKGG